MPATRTSHPTSVPPRVRFRAHLRAVVAITALLLCLPAVASADVTVDFDGLAPETTVTNQYADAGGAGNGVVFGPLPGAGGNGFRPVVKSVGADQAHSGTQVADISSCNNGACGGLEFFPPVTTGTFQTGRSQVSAYVGLDGPLAAVCSETPDCAEVTLQAYDANGSPVGEPSTKTVRRGAGYHTQLSVSTPTRIIRGFRISGRSGFDSNEPVRIENVTFDSPPAQAQPDFTLRPADTLVTLRQGGELRVPIAIERSGGSSGPVGLEVSGLPRGVSARFEPNPAAENAATLVLKADLDAGATGDTPATVSVTGRPAQDSAGSQPRTFPLQLQISGPCANVPDLGGLENGGRVRYCRSAGELVELLQSDYVGRIVLANGGNFDLTGKSNLLLRSGVELIGERGPLGSRPLVRDRALDTEHALFKIEGGDVRVEGIHFRGPDASGDGSGLAKWAVFVEVNRDNKPRNVAIADNEFDNWAPGAAVTVRSKFLFDAEGNEQHCLYTTDCEPLLRPTDARKVRIERNYFHHGKWQYGVDVSSGGYATIEGNVSDSIRHLVASNGHAYTGYVARYNYSLHEAYTYPGGSRVSHFDVHGIGTPEERAKSHYNGGPAGEYIVVAQNTIRGDQKYNGGKKTRPAFGLRGKPTQLAHFHDNVTVHSRDGAINLSGGKDKSLDPDDPRTFNFREWGNRFSTDYSKEIATGDFDGDGRDDLFLANGTGWFYSSGGVRPWSFLRPSEQRVHELGFADVDDDGKTDVLSRNHRGAIEVFRSGRFKQVRTLTSVPVPVKELRFGDFDGDKKADIFYTRNGQWRIWYGRTRAWTSAQTSVQPVSKLLFGEFDGVPGTDVATVLSNRWAYSSGGKQGWATLNRKLAPSFAGAVAADFDGNGRTDIAIVGFGVWRYSPDGRGALRTLRTGAPVGERPQVGRFGTDPEAKAVAINWRGNRLSYWTLGGDVTFSAQNMR